MTTDYMVHCHRCPSRPGGDDWTVPYSEAADPSRHRRSTSRLIGSPEYGALWHCPTHAADCPTCPRGSWTDSHPADAGPYPETRRHRRRPTDADA